MEDIRYDIDISDNVDTMDTDPDCRTPVGTFLGQSLGHPRKCSPVKSQGEDDKTMFIYPVEHGGWRNNVMYNGCSVCLIRHLQTRPHRGGTGHCFHYHIVYTALSCVFYAVWFAIYKCFSYNGFLSHPSKVPNRI